MSDEQDIQWAIEKEDIYLAMREGDIVFRPEGALAHLLLNDVIHLNSRHWMKDLPDDVRNATALFVGCNDVFAWACSDAEELPYHEIENLYAMWRKDPMWGPAVWCIIRRKQMPQKPVERDIRAAGIWDLDSLGLGEEMGDGNGND